jgi:hypothetical protein
MQHTILKRVSKVETKGSFFIKTIHTRKEEYIFDIASNCGGRGGRDCGADLGTSGFQHARDGQRAPTVHYNGPGSTSRNNDTTAYKTPVIKIIKT